MKTKFDGQEGKRVNLLPV